MDLLERGRLEDAEPHALGVGGEPGQGAAERERLVVVEAEPLGHHRGPSVSTGARFTRMGALGSGIVRSSVRGREGP